MLSSSDNHQKMDDDFVKLLEKNDKIHRCRREHMQLLQKESGREATSATASDLLRLCATHWRGERRACTNATYLARVDKKTNLLLLSQRRLE